MPTSLSSTATAAPEAAAAPAVSFSAPVNYPVGGNPSAIVIGDLTGAGRRDVVTLNRNQGAIAVLRSKGDGTFLPAVQYAAPGGPLSIALGDFRGTGKLDIVTADHDSQQVSVFLNKGDGTFQSAVLFRSNGYPAGVAVGDFNGDGKLDIITANQVSGDVSVLLGRGDGTFAAPINTSYVHGTDARAVAVADFNNDGKLDAVVADGYPPGADGATISVLLGVGNGGFGPAQVIGVGNTYETPSVVVTAALTRGGSSDIAAVDTGCGYGGSDVVILLGPTFDSRAGIGDSCVFGVAVADINGDGIPDLVTVNGDSPYDDNAFAKVHLGIGNGVFQPPVVLALSPARGVAAVALADLNGDGKVDIVTANSNTGDISVLLNTTPPPGGGGPPPPIPPLTIAETKGAGNASERQCHCAQGHLPPSPINLATGNFYHSFSDIAIPGRGIPLVFSRTYNSTSASTDGPLGFGWTSSYGNGMSLVQKPGAVTVVQENGAEVTFALSGNTYSAPPRVTATLVKNADATFTFIRNARDHFTFSAAGQLTQEQDLNGYVTTFAHNASGQLLSITDPAKRTLTLAWIGTHISSVTDQTGRSVLFAYDGQGNLTDATDVNGGITRFTYGPTHLLLTMTEPRGGVVTTHYDAVNRVDWQTDQLNRKTSLAYTGDNMSTTGGTTTITDPKGNVSVEQYQYGERMSVTKGAGTPQAATWKYTYDPATLGITSITDPNKNVTTMTYDANGNRLTSKDALNRQTVNTYNSLSEVLTTKDPNGVTTTVTYDAQGNILTTSTPLVGSSESQVTTYQYTDAKHPGDVTDIVDPNGQTWKYSYDIYGDQTSQTDPLGQKTSSTFNTIGWKLATVNPKGRRTTYGYTDAVSGLNKFGDVVTVTDPLKHVSTRHYDANRKVDMVIDPDGNVTSYTYDLANELTVTTRADSPATTLQTSYNMDGTVYQQIDGKGKATTYGYDPLARPTSVTDPLNRVTSATYDGAGNRLTIVDAQSPPRIATFGYDTANQLTGITYSDGTTPNVTNLTYDADGQRKTMTDGTGSSSWAWDSLHRLTSSTDGAGNTVGYGYDLKSQMTSLTYPGGKTVTRTFDTAGRFTAVTDWLSPADTTTFAYDANSNLVKETFPTGTNTVDTFTFDAADRLMRIADATSGKNFATFTYGRDSADQLTSQKATGVGQKNEAYTYTPLNQVKGVNGGSYGYDAADNLTQMPSGIKLAYDDANQLCWTAATSAACSSPPPGATSFSYDTHGNRTGKTVGGSTTTLAYDQANRLTAHGINATYAYDGSGLRQSKTVSGTTTRFLWGGSLLLQDKTGGANPTSYIYGPGGVPVEQVDPAGAAHFYHHDQLGSIRAISSNVGVAENTYTYDPYGNVTASSGTVTNPLQFSGQYKDAESGLTYLRARYYDPATAQFLSRDPMVAATRSPYAYVAGNPLNRSDRTGLMDNHVTEGTDIAAAGASGVCAATAEIPGVDLATCGAAGVVDALAGVSNLVDLMYDPSWFDNIGGLASPCQLASSIGHGHAFDKHYSEYGGGISESRDTFSKFVNHIMTNASDQKSLKDGRYAWWDEASGTIVIFNPQARDFGTAFRPREGKYYFDAEVQGQLDRGMWDG